jgi:outer membrane biosynthesis protein TonB
VPKPSFEQRLCRAERRAFPQPGSIEHDRLMLAEARRKLSEAEAMEAAAEEPTPAKEPPPTEPTPPATASTPQPAPAPAPPAAPPAKRRPRRRPKRVQAPKAEPQWWEERARWKQRGAEDYRWGDVKPNMCLVDYDPIAAFYDEEE